jgi:hypothetical protein
MSTSRVFELYPEEQIVSLGDVSDSLDVEGYHLAVDRQHQTLPLRVHKDLID